MIHWLLQCFADHPELARGEVPPGVLSYWEQQRLAAFHVPQRRRAWLQGRWTAKKLLQAYCQRTYGQCLPLHALLVGRIAGSGAPMAALDPEFAPSGLAGTAVAAVPLVGPAGSHAGLLPAVPALPLPVSLSISHAADWAFCALGEQDAGVLAVGADVESVAPRSPRFVHDFFTAEEIGLVQGAPAESFDLLATAVWSAKEALLKALRLGLTVDTRRVTCLPRLPGEGQSGSAAGPGPAPGDVTWLDVEAACDGTLLGPPDPYGGHPLVRGWWCHRGGRLRPAGNGPDEKGACGHSAQGGPQSGIVLTLAALLGSGTH